MKKAEISYPCNWSYTVIGSDKEVIKTTIPELMHDCVYQLNESKQSKNGKYASYIVTTQVENEKERHKLFHQLKNIPTVKMVL